MDCIEDNATTILIMPNLWCRPTTQNHATSIVFRVDLRVEIEKRVESKLDYGMNPQKTYLRGCNAIHPWCGPPARSEVLTKAIGLRSGLI